MGTTKIGNLRLRDSLASSTAVTTPYPVQGFYRDFEPLGGKGTGQGFQIGTNFDAHSNDGNVVVAVVFIC